jgi:hypothetical protein
LHGHLWRGRWLVMHFCMLAVSVWRHMQFVRDDHELSKLVLQTCALSGRIISLPQTMPNVQRCIPNHLRALTFMHRHNPAPCLLHRMHEHGASDTHCQPCYTCGRVCTTVMPPSGSTTPSMSCADPIAASTCLPTSQSAPEASRGSLHPSRAGLPRNQRSRASTRPW